MAIETKEELLAALNNLDTASNEDLGQLLEAIEAAEEATQSAGSEYDAAITAAEEESANQVDAYNGLVQAAADAKDAAATSASAANANDATLQISAIQAVSSPTLAGTSQADIQAALDALTAAINIEIVHIKNALTALNSGTGFNHLKTAATKLTEFATSAMAAGLPPAVDTQPEIDEVFSNIEEMF